MKITTKEKVTLRMSITAKHKELDLRMDEIKREIVNIEKQRKDLFKMSDKVAYESCSEENDVLEKETEQ